MFLLVHYSKILNKQDNNGIALNTNCLKNSPILRALNLCYKLPPTKDFFFSSLREILNIFINNDMQ